MGMLHRSTPITLIGGAIAAITASSLAAGAAEGPATSLVSQSPPSRSNDLLGAKTPSHESGPDGATAGSPIPGNASTFFGGGTFLSVSSTTGWAFTPSVDVVVTELGMFDQFLDGLIDQHAVGIFEADGTLVVDTLVPDGAQALLRGDSRFVPISPVVLSAGQPYYIAANNNLNDQIVFGNGAVGYEPRLSFDGFLQCNTNILTDPCNILSGEAGNFGPNFRFEELADDLYTVAGCADGFIEISSFGEVLPIASKNDDGGDIVDLPFLFPFDGENHSQIGVSSNGYILVGGTGNLGEFSNAAIPSPTPPNGLIAPLWDDWAPDQAGGVFFAVFGDVGSREAIIQWTAVPHFSGAGSATFQAVLSEGSGKISFRYQDITIVSPTVGVEDMAGEFGVVVATPSDNTCVELMPTCYRQVPCASGFVDISGSGTLAPLASNADDSGDIVPLPFAFDFYGEIFNQIGIASNGYMSLGPDFDLGAFTNLELPDPAAPLNLIAPYWDDWSPNQGGTVVYQTVGAPGSREFIVQWTNVPHFSGSGTATFQAVLFEGTNEIAFRYGAISPNSPTIGLQNQDAVRSLQFGDPGSFACLRLMPTCSAPVASCTGDIDENGSVDFDDLLLVLSSFNSGTGGDANGDGVTDFDDLLLVLSNFGPCV